MSQANTTGASQAQTENANSRPKPRTIIRLLSTKFTPRAPNATPANQPPPPPPTAASKEQRDAALRAVGLLPPLRANKDLSLQEMEQDQHIPIVALPQSETSSDPSKAQAPSTTEAQPSAADLIKKEWATKNQTTSTDESSASQLDRLTTFKFGGSTPSLVVPPPSSDPEPAPTVDGSLSHVSPDQLDIPVPTPPTSPPDQSGSVSSSRNIPPLETTSPQAPTERVPSAPPSPLIDIPEEIRAYMFPLPPSRKASSSSLRSAAPSSPPPNRELPPLPQTPTVPELVLTPSKSSVSVSLMIDGDAGPSDINNNNITVTPQSIPSGESGMQNGNETESGTSTPRPNVVEHNVNDNDGELSLSNLNIPVPNPVLIPAIEIQSPATPSGTDIVAEAEAEAEAIPPSSDSEPALPPAPVLAPASTPTPAEVEETLTALTASTSASTSDSENDVGSPSISSIKTPSLDSSSQTTTTSDSSSAAEASPTPKPLVLAPGRLGSLHVKTTGAERVPSVVIASPVELGHRFSEELDVVIEDEGDGDEVPGVGLEEKEKGNEREVGELGQLNLKGEGNKGTETPRASKMNAPASAPPTTLTFPADATKASPSITPPKKSLMDRRKTLNPFKRSQTVGPNSGSTKAPSQPGAPSTSTSTTSATTTEPKRRLTVGSSFSNIRRSVVGTLSSKSKGNASGSGNANANANASSTGSISSSTRTTKRGKTFDASHLPPSPTIPSSFIGSLGSRGSGGSGGSGGGGSGSAMRLSPPPTPTTSTRLARPVVIHTGGSILEQMAGIEDDETRRVTELAFM